MSLVIAVFTVIVVATLIARFYPHPKPTNTLAQGEILTPEIDEPVQEEVVLEAPKPKKRAPKMQGAKKPKKKTE